MALALDNRVDTTWPDTFSHALVRLGESWLGDAKTPFAASFITPATAVYDNLLTAWPKEANPEDSLILLSRDIEAHLRPHAKRHNVDYFGLTVTTNGDMAATLPFALLYDLKRGMKLAPDESLATDHALWVGYTPLEDQEIEKYLALREKLENQPLTDQALDKLQKWQKNFSRMMAMAQADAALSMEAQTALLGLLKQGRMMLVSITQVKKAQPTDQPQRGNEVRAETQKMREMITRQLANGNLPEPLRAALRQQLNSLREASNDKPVPLFTKHMKAKPIDITIKSSAVSHDGAKLKTRPQQTKKMPSPVITLPLPRIELKQPVSKKISDAPPRNTKTEGKVIPVVDGRVAYERPKTNILRNTAAGKPAVSPVASVKGVDRTPLAIRGKSTQAATLKDTGSTPAKISQRVAASSVLMRGTNPPSARNRQTLHKTRNQTRIPSVASDASIKPVKSTRMMAQNTVVPARMVQHTLALKAETPRQPQKSVVRSGIAIMPLKVTPHSTLSGIEKPVVRTIAAVRNAPKNNTVVPINAVRQTATPQSQNGVPGSKVVPPLRTPITLGRETVKVSEANALKASLTAAASTIPSSLPQQARRQGASVAPASVVAINEIKRNPAETVNKVQTPTIVEGKRSSVVTIDPRQAIQPQAGENHSVVQRVPAPSSRVETPRAETKTPAQQTEVKVEQKTRIQQTQTSRLETRLESQSRAEAGTQRPRAQVRMEPPHAEAQTQWPTRTEQPSRAETPKTEPPCTEASRVATSKTETQKIAEPQQRQSGTSQAATVLNAVAQSNVAQSTTAHSDVTQSTVSSTVVPYSPSLVTEGEALHKPTIPNHQSSLVPASDPLPKQEALKTAELPLVQKEKSAPAETSAKPPPPSVESEFKKEKVHICDSSCNHGTAAAPVSGKEKLAKLKTRADSDSDRTQQPVTNEFKKEKVHICDSSCNHGTAATPLSGKEKLAKLKTTPHTPDVAPPVSPTSPPVTTEFKKEKVHVCDSSCNHGAAAIPTAGKEKLAKIKAAKYTLNG